MCHYRTLKFNCPCFRPARPIPRAEIWVSACEQPQLVIKWAESKPRICLARDIAIPFIKVNNFECIKCTTRRCNGVEPLEFIIRVRMWLDMIDGHKGGYPWMRVAEVHVIEWASFVVHTILPPGRPMQAIEGGGICASNSSLSPPMPPQNDMLVDGEEVDNEMYVDDLDADDLSEWDDDDDDDDDDDSKDAMDQDQD